MGLLDGVVLLFRVLAHFFVCYIEAFIHVFKPPGKKSIEGEIVLITGGGHGIGRQLALDLSKLGTTIVLWDINEENNASVADEINQSGGKALAYTCDVSDPWQIAKVADLVTEDVGDVSILVNNAGMVNSNYFMDTSQRELRKIFNVNIMSHCWMNQQFLPSMIENNHGHILAVSSMAGFFPNPGLVDYCATKFAVQGLADSLGLELQAKGITGIRISTLNPMFTDTGFADGFHIYDAMAPMLTSEEVSRVAVDGLLRNYETITVPPHMYYVHKLQTMLPRRAQKFLVTLGIIKIIPQGTKYD